MSFRARAWHAVRHDIGRKLTALGLALGVWFVLEGMVLEEQSEPLDVKPVSSVAEADAERLAATRSTVYLVVPDSLDAQFVDPASLRLRVKGLKEDVRGLVLSAVLEFTEADLAGAKEATVSRTLGRDEFKGRGRSPELTLFRLNGDATATLSVRLVRRSSWTMELKAVNVTLTGLPARGYAFDGAGVRIVPNLVTVSGPMSWVDQLKTQPGLLKLAPISVEGMRANVTQSVGLSQLLLDQQMRLTPEKVQVTVTVSPEDKEVTLVAMPIAYENEDALLALGFQIVERPPASMDIRLRGPAPELERFTPEQLAKNIRLVFDFKSASLLNGFNRPSVTAFLYDLPTSVKVLGLESDEPKIEFKLLDTKNP